MKKVVLIFGLLSGAVSSAMMFLTVPFMFKYPAFHKNGEVIGYTAIFLSFLLVFFGIRSYRENAGGTISFGRGTAVGLLITLISCAFYVGSWEIIYFKLMPDFVDRYAAREVVALHEKGATEATIAAKKKEMVQMKALLDNPLTNAAMTFIEPFPVGLLVTLISAAILRKRNPPAGAVVAQAV
jgi:hypothetical protein